MVIDRISKNLIIRFLEPGDSAEIFTFRWFQITHHVNTGVAFGLFAEFPAAVLLINGLIILAIIWFYFFSRIRKSADTETFALGLILGGALGNFYDRLIYSAVIDFIDLRVWPVFNIADSFICIGAAILIFKSLAGIVPAAPSK